MNGALFLMILHAKKKIDTVHESKNRPLTDTE